MGFDHRNDRIVRNILASKRDAEVCAPQCDQRGKKSSPKAFDKTIIEQHIESYNPSISHYRREHAPHRRYLPSDISIKDMHQNFLQKSQHVVSYEVYRKVVTSKDISFVKLGHEECWQCEKRDIHEKTVGHCKDNLVVDCEVCSHWKIHNYNYIMSREEYQKDATSSSAENNDVVLVSMDLQKVSFES